jgi:hypothetical protein
MKTRITACLFLISIFIYSGSASAFWESSNNNYFGGGAGYYDGGQANSFFGAYAGFNNIGDFNTFIGNRAGYSNAGGSSNTIIGFRSGYNAYGAYNTLIGAFAGEDNASGVHNILIGFKAGHSTKGGQNTIIGNYAGVVNLYGDFNTYLGFRAGYSNVDGEGNVFLGNQSGYSETGSNKLYIENSDSSAPLIYGEFDNDFVEINGDFYVTGNTYFNSDEDLKKEIKSIESSLEKILGLQGVSYKWKNRGKKASSDKEGSHYGVIAQQVEKVLPEVVKEDDDGIRKVAYMELIPVLIEAVKEQQEAITKLSEKVQHLEKELKLRSSLAMDDIH